MAKSPRSYSQRDLKTLWGLSGGVCAFPGCNVLVIDSLEDSPPLVIGEVAHILASSDKGPRPTASDPILSLDQYENLLILCPTHHTLIDKRPDLYPESALRQWKKAHEAAIRSTVEHWKE